MSQPTGDPQSGVDPNAQSGVGGGTQDPSNNVGGSGAGDSGSAQSGDGQTPKTFTQAEYDQLMTRLQAADRRASAAETKLGEIDKAKLSELERAQAEAKEAKEALVAAQEAAKDAALGSAFAMDQTYSWHNPATALKLMDRDGVEVGDDGTVKGLKPALDRLAKDHPYLIKTADGTGTGSSQGQTGATGVPGNAKPQGSQKDQSALERKFPALRGRVAAS